MDDMYGTNWTTLTQSQPINGATYSFSSPVAVALDSSGKIYVADNEYFAGALIRVDDMTGANWTSIYFGPQGTSGPNSIAVDVGGTVFAGGGAGGSVRLVDNMAACSIPPARLAHAAPIMSSGSLRFLCRAHVPPRLAFLHPT